MKKNILATAALAAILAGCTPTPSTDYTVTGIVTDSQANGQTVYIQRYDGGTKIDSTVVKDNRYTFSGRTDSVHFCQIIVPHEGFANFILEPGDIVVNTNPDTYNQPSGTPMNDELARIVAGEKTYRKQMWTRIHEQKKQYPDSLRFDSVKRAILAKESEDSYNRTMDLLKQHPDDAIGYYLLANHYVSPRLQEVVSVLGPWLKSTRLAQTLQRTAAALEHTAEGQPFVDVELRDIHGNPAPLSNYVGRSEYVLLNMWHADCPHCHENMPRLAQLHHQFKDKGLIVLGLFLDGAANLPDALAEHHIKWPQLIDSGKKFGTPYGLNDLHASILFAPNGTILKRNIRGEEMVQTVTDVLTRTAEGQPFVDVKGKNIYGNPVALSDYIGKGNYVLMDMWASWCGPCRAETPNLAKLHNRFKDKGLTVLGLFVWDEDKNLPKAMEEEHIDWPQIIDSEKNAATLYGVYGIPHIILFAPDGTIQKRNLRGEKMVQTVTNLLTGKK